MNINNPNTVIDFSALTDEEFTALAEKLFGGYEQCKRFSDWFYRNIPATAEMNRQFRSILDVMGDCFDSWITLVHRVQV